jgi:hypothetical protein
MNAGSSAFIEQDGAHPALPAGREGLAIGRRSVGGQRGPHQARQRRRPAHGVAVMRHLHAAPAVHAREAQLAFHRHVEGQQPAPRMPSGEPLEAAGPRRAGDEAGHAGHHAGRARFLRLAHFHAHLAAPRQLAGIQARQRGARHQPRAGDGRARVPGQLDRVDIVVFEHPAGGGAQRLRQPVLQDDARRQGEEIGGAHRAAGAGKRGGSRKIHGGRRPGE